MSKKIEITPETKLGVLLRAYPQLEEELVALSPSFARLKNPLLRKTVGKVASLRQVAEVGNLPVGELVNFLRQKAGLPDFSGSEEAHESATKRPEWLRKGEIKKSLDARPILESGGHPLEQVMKEMAAMPEGGVYELVTPFLPAPLLDVLRKKGYPVWSEKIEDNLVKNYFLKTKSANQSHE